MHDVAPPSDHCRVPAARVDTPRRLAYGICKEHAVFANGGCSPGPRLYTKPVVEIYVAGDTLPRLQVGVFLVELYVGDRRGGFWVVVDDAAAVEVC